MATKARRTTAAPRSRRRTGLLALTLLTAALGGVRWWQTQGGVLQPAGRLSGDFHTPRVLPDSRLLSGQRAGVAVSSDGGRTWGLPSGTGDATALASAARSPGPLVMAGRGVLKTSRDGGQSWRDAGFGNLPGTDIHGFVTLPNRPDVWDANLAGRGFYRTENGRDWRFVSPATAGTMRLAAGPGAAPRLSALSRGEGVIVSDGGAAWQRAGAAPRAAGSGLDVHPVSGNVELAGPTGVARSEDQGARGADPGLPEGALLVDADPRDRVNLDAAGGSGTVNRSVDGGKTWSA